MLDQFTINHIKNAFDLAEAGELSQQAKQRVCYCRKLIKQAEDKIMLEQANAYATAIGSAEIARAKYAQHFIDMIADDCAAHGSD
jgi:hypothetical protein